MLPRNKHYRRRTESLRAIAELKLSYPIATVTEPAGSILRSDGFEAFGDGLLQSFSGAGLSGAQELFELGPGVFDGVEVRRVGRQIEQLRPAGGEQLLDPSHLVCRQIIH